MSAKIKRFSVTRCLICILALLFVVTCGAFICTVSASVSVNSTGTLSYISLNMRKGASVRTAGGLGLRYSFTMSEGEYNLLKDSVGEGKQYSDLYFGVFIAPTTYTDVYSLNEENLFGTRKKYDWAERDGSYTGSNGVNGKPYRIINVYGNDELANLPASQMVDGESGNLKVFNGSVVNMKSSNLLTEYNAVGYACLTKADGNVEYKLASPNDNERSIVYVAQRAIEAGKDVDGEIERTYLTQEVKSVSTQYIEEYYFEQTDGTFRKNNSLTQIKEANVHSSATIEDKTFAGYRFDQNNENNVITQKVYANGSTVLKKYYAFTDEFSGYLPEGESLGLSIEDIFLKAQAQGLKATNVKEFLTNLAFTEIKNVLAKGNNLVMTLVDNGRTFSFNVNNIKQYYPVNSGVTDKIYTLNIIQSGRVKELAVTYEDGTVVNVGVFDTLNTATINGISTIAVNSQNELLLVLEDRAIVKCGTLSTAGFNIEGNALIFEKVDGKEEYRVIGSYNKSLKDVVIPDMHRGLPVTEVGQAAFKENTVIQSVVFGKNVSILGARCFIGCTALTKIGFKNVPKIISYNAFTFCEQLSTVQYKGTETQVQEITIRSGNELLSAATWTYYSFSAGSNDGLDDGNWVGPY